MAPHPFLNRRSLKRWKFRDGTVEDELGRAGNKGISMKPTKILFGLLARLVGAVVLIFGGFLFLEYREDNEGLTPIRSDDYAVIANNFNAKLPASFKIQGVRAFENMWGDVTPRYYVITINAPDFQVLVRNVKLEETPWLFQESDWRLSYFAIVMMQHKNDLPQKILNAYRNHHKPEYYPLVYKLEKDDEGKRPGTLIVDTRTSPSLSLYVWGIH